MIRRAALPLAVGMMTMAAPSPGLAATGACEELLPSAIHNAPPRVVTSTDLVRLRDIGRSETSVFDKSSLAVSPDQRKVAFVLRRAEPGTNSYCQGLVVLDIKPAAQPKLIDEGGEAMLDRLPDLRGLVMPLGLHSVNRPVWSPDGQWIAYRKRLAGSTQVWLVSADGREKRQLTHLDDDVATVAWAAANTLIAETYPDFRLAQQAIDQEALSGFHYDERMVPTSGVRPFPRAPLPPHWLKMDVPTGAVREAAPEEIAAHVPWAAPPGSGEREAISAKGLRAWTRRRDPSSMLAPADLWAALPGGDKVRCAAASCADGIVNFWWSPDGREIRYWRVEGWGSSRIALYRWQPGDGRVPRRMLTTPDVIAGCEPVSERLLCLQDGSAQPRRLVLIDPRNGRIDPVFDPNPEFTRLSLGRVRRLHWRSDHGLECFGDLVLPPGHRAGETHPLIVVQYVTKGFLRGGTGDEYPVQAFAARGYAVLVVQRPPDFASAVAKGRWRDWEEAETENVRGWQDRRSVLSAVMGGLEAAEALDIVDKSRIGITGLSDGATTTWFALINTDRFAAAAVSTCCADPHTNAIMGGPAWQRALERYGYPPPTTPAAEFWRPVSPAMNAARIRAPILMQLSGDEYARGLEAFTALTHTGPPVDLYVFPGEHHIKWQPAHRLAIYERNLDWFDFWLRGIEDLTPAKADQYANWRALRANKHRRAEEVPPPGAGS